MDFWRASPECGKHKCCIFELFSTFPIRSVNNPIIFANYGIAVWKMKAITFAHSCL